MNPIERKLLWWRHTWTFDWAHKPLCGPYSGDVLRIGRLHLCRGCAALWMGFFVGSALALTKVITVEAHVVPAAALFVTIAALSSPAWYGRWPRPMKDGLRFATGVLATAPLALFVAGEWKLALMGILFLGAFYWAFTRIRAPRRLAKCESCAELDQGVCSGYALQTEAIRGWEEAAATRFMAGGFIPTGKRGRR